ncbi:MAG: exodeoxyribonuclease III [Alphaproteobacteria bacterium]|nr:exodeoxyribonuclease III [Alphaproteobacteria bacterium]
MRLVTWNINSVRLRFEQLAQMVEALSPDVVCLQETKVPCPKFPLIEARALGFDHIATSGMKGYNGVAILSRLPLSDIRAPHWCGREDCRHLVAQAGGVEVHCLYVPAGGDIPDPAVNEKFAHKLAFLDELTAWYASEAFDSSRPAILAGDLNVAPLEADVWSHKQLLKVVSHTPVEVDKLTRFAQAGGWIDAVRHFVPPSERLYTWWSYRALDWRKADRGRRLDHVWVTPSLKGALSGAQVFKASRDWPQPSDHVPVVVDLAV